MAGDNVVQFGKRKDEPQKAHLSGSAKCLACKHEWVAVTEITNSEGYQGDLECPECGCHRGQYVWPFQGPPEEEVWTCIHCDSQLFMITRPGTRCVGCGAHHTFNG